MSQAERFLALWGEVEDLGRAAALLEWDQETQMPERGAADRGRTLGALAGVRHQKLSADELATSMEAAAGDAEAGSPLAAQVREARRHIDRVRKIPESLAREKAEAQSAGHETWKKARAAKDFAMFAPSLKRLVELAREEAKLVAGDGNAYDALLDLYEPGATEAELIPLFDGLVAELSPIVKAVAESGVTVDEAPARGNYPAEAQLAFGRRVAEQMGFDFSAGRIDRAAHPFCSGFGAQDVRITWRWLDDDFRSALYGIMHEAGHGLYEQGLPERWNRTPIGLAASLGVHESQSRMWENLVGRSRAFWDWAMPLFQEHFPEKRGLSADELWPTLHTVKPSYIRVEADQGTYDLHIAVRFDVERRILSGELEVGDLSEAWDDAYERLLGILPRDVAEGVLQDIHWSMGGFGYFPTYTLGNLIAAQLFDAAQEAVGNFDERFARGEFGDLLAWLRENVHDHGASLPVSELVRVATGKPLSTDAFLRNRKESARRVYGVDV